MSDNTEIPVAAATGAKADEYDEYIVTGGDSNVYNTHEKKTVAGRFTCIGNDDWHASRECNDSTGS